MQKLWIGTAMETIAQDIHYALRMLPRNPGFTAVSVLTLAAGISIITCVFGLSNAFFLRPLPFKDPAQLVHVWQTDANVSWDTARVSVPNYNDWREQNTVFEDLGGYFYTTYTLTTSSANRKVLATLLTPNLFDVLGAKPVLGRTFAQEEGQAGRGDVAVLSYHFWQNQFAGSGEVRCEAFGRKSSRLTQISPSPPFAP